MEFEICKDIDECKKVWNLFSPNERLFDIWDFRACFFDANEHELHFIIGYGQDEVEGFIPLVLNKKSSKHEYLGGWFPAERNLLHVKDKKNLKLFLEQCPESTLIEGLDPIEGYYYNFQSDEYLHYLDLSRYNYDFDAYFDSLDKKRQKNLRQEIKNIPEYKIYTNRIKDCDRLIELNIERFGEDSKFNDKSITNGILKLVKLANDMEILDMISLEINKKVEAVDIGVFLNQRYYALIGSSNYQKIPNLGKLMIIIDIKNAISKKTRCIEFGATADHWKNMWKFEKDMLLKFEK